MPNVNPFEPPVVPISDHRDSEVSPKRFRWILLPSVLFGVLGCLSFLFGVFAILMTTYVLFVENGWSMLGEMIAGTTLYIGTGVSWIIAGREYWKRRYTVAIAATIIGFAIPAALFAVFGY